MRARYYRKHFSLLQAAAIWLVLVTAMLGGCDNETLIEGQEIAAAPDGSADADAAQGQSDGEADGQLDVLVATDTVAVSDTEVGSDAEDILAGSDADPTDADDLGPDATDVAASDVVGSDSDSTGIESDSTGSDSADVAAIGSDTSPDQLGPDGAPAETDAAAMSDGVAELDTGTDAGGPANTDASAGSSDSLSVDQAGASDATTDATAAGSDTAADATADAAEPGTDDAVVTPDDAGADALADSTADALPDPDVAGDAGSSDDTAGGADAGADGSDTTAPVVCTTDTPCLPLGQVCDPLAKQCVQCLWDDDCGILAQCIERQCVPVMPCQNSLACLTAVGASGEPLPICDAQQGLCVACLTSPDCGDGFECQDQACVAVTACQNSIVCGADAVCDTQLGQCVQCLSPADCGASEVCEAGKCVDYLACSSDKQCTPKGMLCDTTKGKCASCLKNSDCPAIYHCAPTAVGGTGQCVLDVCQQGESQCDANQVASCNAVGDGWTTPISCPPQTTCTTSAGVTSCTPWVCQPGPGCQDGKAIVCSSNGLTVETSIDCGASGGVCDNAQCKTPICTAGSTWCVGAALQTCSANGLAVTSSAPCPGGSHCTPSGCAINVCTPNQPTCSGNTAGVCNDVGSGLLAGATPCGELLCVQGECKALLCVPSTTVCDGNVRKTCSADGLSIAASNPCAGDEYCSNGSCLPQVCTPNAPLCNGQTAQVCNGLGSGYVGAGTPCNPNTEVCKAGSCQPKICTPASQFCDGEVLKTCSADGTQVTTSTSCGSGSYCGASPQANAACLPTVCTPNAAGCNGLFATTCNTNGSGWLVSGTDCSLTSQVCSAGQCKSLACDPETPLYCDGNVVKACSTDGLTVSVFDTCASTEYCATAACQAQVCSPGTAGCLGNQPAVCNDVGSGQTATGAACGSGTSCSAGICINCVPSGAELCDGADNDCDGQTDEADAAPLCDDDNDCTTDTCGSAGSCQYVPVAAGKPCGDDAECMVDRVCSAGGVCTAGASRYFDKTYTLAPDTAGAFLGVTRMTNGDLVVLGSLAGTYRLYRMTPAGATVWQTEFAINGSFLSMALDEFGSIYIVRSTGITKFSAAGVFQWTYTTERTPAVAVIPGGGAYVLVRTESFKVCDKCFGYNECNADLGHNLSFIRLSSAGTVQSTTPINDLYADGAKFTLQPQDMILSPDGNLAVRLRKDSFCSTGINSILMKLSSTGTVLYWADDQYKSYRGLYANGNGYVLLFDTAYWYVDKNFVTTGSKSVTAGQLAIAPNGDVYTGTSSSVSTPAGNVNIYTIRRYSPGGALRWTKILDNSAQGTSSAGRLFADQYGLVFAGTRNVSELARGWLVSMDEWGHTSCAASGDCWQTAVTACDACSAELCDGLDNDCNGATDELSCDDDNPCTSATCNGSSCVAAAQNGVACQDGNACTTGDLCQGGTCQPGPNGTCDDNNPCTADSCTLQAGCLHAPVDGCTAPVCVAGTGGCFGNQPTVCNVAGSAYVASGPACGAGTVCAAGTCVTCVPSGAEVCDGKDNDCDGQIDEAGAEPLCDDGNSCTTDTCTTSGSCQFVPVAAGQPCSDAGTCTVGQTCSADGVCQGGNGRFFDRTYVPETTNPGFGRLARLPGGDLVAITYDGWLVRLDPQGEVVWKAAMISLTSVQSLTVDNLGGIYVGGTNGVRKYNDSGVSQWTYPTARETAIVANPSGGVFIVVRTQSIQGCGKCPGYTFNQCKQDMGHQLALIQLNSAGAEQANMAIDPLPVVTSVIALYPVDMQWSADGHLIVSLINSNHCGTGAQSLLKLSTSGAIAQWKESVGGYAKLVKVGDGHGLLLSDRFDHLDADLNVTDTFPVAASFAAGTPAGDIYTSSSTDLETPNGTIKVVTVRRFGPDGTLRWSLVLDHSGEGNAYASNLLTNDHGVTQIGYRKDEGVNKGWVVQMDGWGHTSCEASGDCWETPLTACSACAAETCDNTDNDCDGNIDEQTCADTSPCMDNSCNGSSCVKTVKNKVACQDGDPCTSDDTCQGGYCKSGPSWNCDDNNPCTADSCSTATGCKYTPVSGPGCGG
jgi:hypothetical protein